MAALRKPVALCAAISALLAFTTNGASAQASADPVVEQFFSVCGGNGVEAQDRLPGVTVAPSDIPAYFESDVQRSGENHRVTQIDGVYAMRAIMRAGADPNAIVIKCAIASNLTGYDQALASLSAVAGTAPRNLGGDGQLRRAMFAVANVPYQIFEEAEGWISIYRMDIMISARGIDPDYLREGAQPMPVPTAQ
jgi:hypothetical protein